MSRNCDLVIAFTGDEETGMLSARRLVNDAIYALAAALSRLEAHRFPVQTTDDAADVLWREPEFVGITRTTCVATMLRRGHAENALPQSATATVNRRVFPGTEVAEVQATLERVTDTPGLRVRALGTPKPSPASPLRDDVVSAVTAAVHARYPGIPIIPYMAPYGTDGLEVRSGGIPTYGVLGLFIKDSDQFAHGLNERVPVREFFGVLEHWEVLLTRLAGAAGSRE